jgi:phage regulator Rha-like protein
MYELTIIKQDGGAYIDSREIAEVIGIRHDHLLRDIGNCLDIIEDFTEVPYEGSHFFMESSYLDAKGRTRLNYLVSKIGCEMITNKLTYENCVPFTYAYTRKFEEFEKQERERRIAAEKTPRLDDFNTAVKNILKGMAYCRELPKRVMNFLRGVYEPLGIEILSEGDEIDYYTATEIAVLLGIYSESGRPHGHAVSSIIARLENSARYAVVIPYGIVGISVRYNEHIIGEVRKWIENNNYPHEVPHLYFCYHIFYKRLKTAEDDFDEVINLG